MSIKQNKKEISVYPNPTIDFLNFQLENNNANKLRLFDANGREVYNSEIINNRVDVSNLTSGLYLGILEMNNFENFTFKFVKK